jgi:hypothetical protein
MRKLLAYWSEFFEELKIWWRFRKVAQQNEKLLNENGMRVDWLGRIYTVINMPEEVQTNNMEIIQQGWVIGQLKPLNAVLFQMGIADYAYPSISKVPDSASFLVVMWPELDNLNIWKFLGRSIITSLIIAAVYWTVQGLIWLDIPTIVKNLKGA